MNDTEQVVLGEQPLSEQERKLVDEVYSRLSLFEQNCRPFHDAARVCREVVRLNDPGQNPPAKSGEEKIEVLQLHTLKSTINNMVADQMENLPEPRLLPETPEMKDAAEDLQDAVRFVVYDVNRYQNIHRRRTEDFYVTGTAITQVVWDDTANFGKGDVAIFDWPIEAFLWDPMAENLQDARALIKVSWMPMSWFEQHYPDAYPYIGTESGEHREVGLHEAQREISGADEQRALLLEYWYRRYNAKTKRYTINVAYCAGHALLDHAEDVYAHGMYPFVADVHDQVRGTPVGEGAVGELTPMMRYINRYAHYIDLNLRMSSKGRLLARKGAGIDREALADFSKDIIEGDRIMQGEDWAWLQHAPFNGLALQMLMQMQSDLKMDSGANQFTRGETTGGVVSGKGITAMIEAGGKISGLRTDILNEGFRQIVEQVIWLMAEFYKKDRVVHITGKRKPKSIKMGENIFGKRVGHALPPPPYAVQVEINRRNPARVDAMNEMYMNAYTMAAQAQQFFPLSALFELLTIEGKDRLMPVIEANENHMQQLQQLQQQLEGMTQQMEQMKAENDSLRATSTQMTNALANIGAQAGAQATPAVPGGMPPKVTQAPGLPGGRQLPGAMADQAHTNTNQMMSGPMGSSL